MTCTKAWEIPAVSSVLPFTDSANSSADIHDISGFPAFVRYHKVCRLPQ